MRKIYTLLLLIMFIFMMAMVPSAVFAAEEEIKPNYIIEEVIWNESFESRGLKLNGASVQVAVDSSATNVLINSDGESLEGNTGSLSNTITIENSSGISGRDNGSSLKIATNDATAECQMNGLWGGDKNGFLLYSLDLAVESLPPEGKSFASMRLYYNDRSYFTLGINSDGYFAISGENLTKCQVKCWHNLQFAVNTDTGITDVFIDGTHAYRATGQNLNTVTYPRRIAVTNGKNETVTWIDNYGVYKIKEMPEIKSVTADGKYMNVEFNTVADKALFKSDGGVITNFFAASKGNQLVFKNCEETDNSKVLRFKADKEIFTSAQIDIKYSYTDALRTLENEYSYTSSAASFDVKSVNFEQNSNELVVTAQLANSLSESQTAIMLVSLYDTDGSPILAHMSKETVIDDEADITVKIANKTATTAKVFFIKDDISYSPIKNYIYEYDFE